MAGAGERPAGVGLAPSQDAAIQTCLSLKAPFGLALRPTIGMVASLFKMAGPEDWPVPDTSTLCRRQKTVGIQIPFRRLGGDLNLLVDGTGVKMRSHGEWQVRRHGPSRRREWRKVHLALEAATEDIQAVEVTRSREGDSPVLPDLLDQIPRDEPIGTVAADGAFDTRRCHAAIIPIRKNGCRRTRGWSRHQGAE